MSVSKNSHSVSVLYLLWHDIPESWSARDEYVGIDEFKIPLMANSANNQSHLKQQIRELNHQYKEALQKGEEFGKLKEIRDKIKELKKQLYTDTESLQPDTDPPDLDTECLQSARTVQSV